MNATPPSSVVILGAGQAGAWAAKTLRDEGYRGSIALVGDEQHAPYERPPLSKAMLIETAALSPASVFSDATLSTLSIDWRKGVRAESLDLHSRRITLSDGGELAYGKLILCTGGRALRPPIPGMDLRGVFTLRTMDDCVQLRNAMRAAQRVCIVGGGWIGLEVASTAREMGRAVTLLHRADRLCERVLPAQVSADLLALHLAGGVDVRLNSEARAIESSGALLDVICTDGACVSADMVVVAAGLAPNDELAIAAGIECNRGILVDHRCRTSDAHVLAAGDVAVAPNKWAGQPIRLESWQNATEQAVVAAKVALGKDAQYDPLPWFWSDQLGTNLQIYGWPQPRHRVVSRTLGSPGSQIHFLLDGPRVEGAIAINAPRELRMSRRLIEQAIEVNDAQLRDPGMRLSSL
jgi:3-phenylpropionate/trans-cinnamate dioxygenase ferredoxin reductase component